MGSWRPHKLRLFSPLLNPFSPLLNLFSPLLNPFSPLLNPFSPLLIPFSPLLNPFSPLLNPFSPLLNPFSPLLNPFSPLLTPLFHEHSHRVFGVLLYAISKSCDTDFTGQVIYKPWVLSMSSEALVPNTCNRLPANSKTGTEYGRN